MDCESDYEYDSDNEYHGDNEVSPSFDDISISYVPIDVPNRQWTILCMKFEKFYKNICTYDEDTHRIYFNIDNKGFALLVDDEYPYTAPKIEYTREIQMPLDSYIPIMNNIVLSKSQWNICNDIPKFVENVIHIINNTDDYVLTEFDKIVVELVELLMLKYSFNDNLLPAFGEKKDKIESKNRNTYLRSDEEIKKIVSPAIVINPFLEQLLSLDTNQNSKYLMDIIRCISDIQITSLELMMNETYYKNIILVAQKYSLDVNLDHIDVNQMKTTNTDKFQIVDEFVEHSFKNRSKSIQSSLTKRIFAEIETIKESISDFECYVLASEADIRQLKLLFIPDYDTPYGGGYFEFDMFIPNNYPSSPPLVKFLTTGNGKMRFNPNLYDSGKVCLSVLNTWSTNQWDPSQSTISQVILSINSMIFIAHPYTNEPVFYDALLTQSGREKSDAYNNNIIHNCFNIAIKNQITNKHTPFKDIIHIHWNKNGSKTQSHYESIASELVI